MLHLNKTILYTNKTLKDATVVYTKPAPPPYAGSVLVVDNFYHYALTNYSSVLNSISVDFKNYMEMVRDAYSG